MLNLEMFRSITKNFENESISFTETQLWKKQNCKKRNSNFDIKSYSNSDFVLMTRYRVTLNPTIDIIGVILKR